MATSTDVCRHETTHISACFEWSHDGWPREASSGANFGQAAVSESPFARFMAPCVGMLKACLAWKRRTIYPDSKAMVIKMVVSETVEVLLQVLVLFVYAGNDAMAFEDVQTSEPWVVKVRYDCNCSVSLAHE